MTALTAAGGLQAGGLEAGRAAGRRLLVTAASSGVGVAALQMARAWGAETIAATTSSAKVDALAALADWVVVVEEGGAAADEILGLTEGRGVDVAFDAVGYANAELLFRVAADYGRIVFYGIMAGTRADLDMVAMLRRNLGVHGFTIYRLLARPPLLDRAVEQIQKLVALGHLLPPVDSVHPFAKAPEALMAMAKNLHLGKIVVEVGGSDAA